MRQRQGQSKHLKNEVEFYEQYDPNLNSFFQIFKENTPKC